MTGIGVAAIAVENVQAGKDPVPSLLAGAAVMFGTSVLSQWDSRLGMAFAVVFTLGAIISHPDSFHKATGAVQTAITSGGGKSSSSKGNLA